MLVPNLRGAERAFESKADEFNLVMSTSETHNLANLRMGREKSFAGLAEVIKYVNGRTPINVSLSTCFGCPMEGGPYQSIITQIPEEVNDGFVRYNRADDLQAVTGQEDPGLQGRRDVAVLARGN